MFTAAEMRGLANQKRADAERARRWAAFLLPTIDKDRLLQHAVELDGEADDLERQVGNAQ